ncbi:MAG: hypothetical protein IKW87_07650 [Ruminococcus sp.]|nr:hypothetical protein [Ruminococcus sp.]
MKKFIITIDTEGDNLWDWKPGSPITTENASYLQRFQDLAEKYGFKPVWLANYEMLQNERFIDFINKIESNKCGELGMHLHAWNTPPLYDLPVESNGAPYLIEYPEDYIEYKVKTMTELIKEKTGVLPVSHRAGRWAMNETYFRVLNKYGYRVDCSVTPHIDWSNSCGQTLNSKGSDYSFSPDTPHYVCGVLEIPVSVLPAHKVFLPDEKSPRRILGSVYHAIKGQNLWLRPNGKNLSQMLWLLKRYEAIDADYIMFMLHSSEMMPGGSPTFQNKDSIEQMYSDCEELFKTAHHTFEGITLRDYAPIAGGKCEQN